MNDPEAPIIVQALTAALAEEEHKRQVFYDSMTSEELKAEFINGEVIVHSPVKKIHGDISSNAFIILKTYVIKHKLGFVGHEKIMIRLTRNDYEPDVCFFKKEIAATFEEKQSLFPAPHLAVEVLSKNTKDRNRGIKFEDYASHGVEEYWIIDPDTKTVEQYFLKDGRFELFKKTDTGEIESRAVWNLRFPVECLFDEEKNQELIKEILLDQ